MVNDAHLPTQQMKHFLSLQDCVNPAQPSEPQPPPSDVVRAGHLLYAAMLTHAMRHFPLEDGRLGIVWTWLDTDGRNKCTTYSGSTEPGRRRRPAAQAPPPPLCWTLLFGFVSGDGGTINQAAGIINALPHPRTQLLTPTLH